MTHFEKQTVCLVSADKVWRMLGRFDRLAEWHPLVDMEASVTEHNAKRRLVLSDGGYLEEQLIEVTDDLMRTAMTSSTWPLNEMEFAVRVTEAGIKRSQITWEVRFEAADEADSVAVQTLIETFVDQAFFWLNGRYGKDYSLSA